MINWIPTTYCTFKFSFIAISTTIYANNIFFRYCYPRLNITFPIGIFNNFARFSQCT